MKKTLALILVLTLCISLLAGCGQTGNEPSGTPDVSPSGSQPADPPTVSDPVDQPSEPPSSEPSPAPSEEPVPSEEPSPAPSEEPVSSSLPDIYKDLASNLPSGTYESISFTDNYKQLSFTFEQAYIVKGTWGNYNLVVKPGSNFTVEIITDEYYFDNPYISADMAIWGGDLETNEPIYIVFLSEEWGAQYGTEITSGCVDTIFTSLAAFVEELPILPFVQFNEYEEYYEDEGWSEWIREKYIIVPGF